MTLGLVAAATATAVAVEGAEAAAGVTARPGGDAGRRFLLISINNVCYAVNAFKPIRSNPLLFGQSFFASWITIELAWLHLVVQVVTAGIYGVKGAWRTREGKIAFGLTAASIGALIVSIKQSLGAKDEVRAALADLGSVPPERKGLARKVTKNIVFAEVDGVRLKLDVTQPAEPPAPGERRPALIQIHGGGWVIGDKREQGLPLIRRMASEGWVCFNVNYRLSPKVHFPTHLQDVKRAIAWVRAHADEYSVDPDFLAVTGGSAGGHLTALAGLTANDPRLQPGFEDDDTSVQAAVPFYGIYDFTDRNHTWQPGALERFVEPIVMKCSMDDDPDMWALASPIDQVGPHAPPFFVIHGDKDTLASPEGARIFSDLLREVSHEPVFHVELQGAQHAFELFPSIRANAVIDGVAHFLDNVHQRHLERQAEYTAAGRQPLGA